MRLPALLLLVVSSGCVHRTVTVPPDDEGEKAEEPPAGKIAVSLVPDDDVRAWEVWVSDEYKCAVPCTQWLAPSDSLFLKSNRGDRIFVPSLGAEAERARHAVVVAGGVNEGERVNGIVWTTLGGMALVTGITLTAVGCSNVEKRGGTCVAGLITGGVALPLTAVAIWMIVDASPVGHVLPVFKHQSGSVAITPAGIAGTF